MADTKEYFFKNVIKLYCQRHTLGQRERDDLMACMVRAFGPADVISKQYSAQFQHKNTNEYLIEKFIEYKKLTGRTEKTRRQYAHTLHHFLSHSKANLATCNTNDIRNYLVYMEDCGCAKPTLNNARRNLNIFFQFMEDEEYIKKNPCKRIGMIKEEKRIKRFYTDLEIEMLHDNCKTKRELAIIDLLTSTGLRIGEISNIYLEEINWEDRSIFIHGKGSKDRYTFFSPKAKKHLLEYLEERTDDCPYLFVNARRKDKHQLTAGGIQDVIHKIGARCGIPDVTCHDIRRWYANDLYKKGANEYVIQELLGHSSFETTRKYYTNTNLINAKHVHEIYAR